MDKIFLRFVTFLTPVLEKTGVDTDQLYYIIQVKLMMDNRRPRAGFTAGKNSQSSTKVKSPWAINVFTVVLGFFIGMVLFISSAPYIAQTLYFTVFMVMLALTLISDFTTVLMDPRDQYILLPRPVNDRTIAVSRILHITIYVLRLALLQGAPGLILVGFVDGIAAVPLFFVQILEATFVAIFSVNIVYLLLMRMVSAERFKDIISYVQVGFSVLIFATYYLLPKLINFSALNHISLLSHKWAYALPPVWITALNELLIHRDRSGLITGVLAVIGITVPLLGLWLIAKVLAPGFNRRLAEMSMSEIGLPYARIQNKILPGLCLRAHLFHLLCIEGQGAGSFQPLPASAGRPQLYLPDVHVFAHPRYDAYQYFHVDQIQIIVGVLCASDQ
jgi:ABC-2 type transport system permease protein